MKHHLFISMALLGALFSSTALATPAQLKSIEESEGAERAYQYGLSIETQYAGDPAFDWPFAQIALKAQHPDVAVFIFERILIVNPNDHAARLELARAYYLTGDYDNALAQFQTVEAENPSPQTMANIERYLHLMQQSQQPLKPTLTGTVGLQMGYDTNVNSSTSGNSVNIPNLGPVPLQNSAEQQRAPYAEIQGSILGEHPLSSTTRAFAQVDSYYQWYREEKAFDVGDIYAQAGFEFDLDKHSFKMPIAYERMFLDASSYRNYYGVMPLWTYRQNTQLHYTGFIQAGEYRYEQNLSSQNTNLVLGSGGVTYRFNDLPLTVMSSAFYGNESAQTSGNPQVSRDIYGAQAGLQWAVQPRHILYTTALWQRSPYDAVDPVFLVTRKDTYITGSVGWYWQKTATLAFQVEVDYLRNNSNIILYEYDRWITFFQVRQSFG